MAHNTFYSDPLISRLTLEQQLLQAKNLAKFTSWRIGGDAEQYYRPANISELGELLQSLPANTPITWLGLGSNVLIRDGGIPGIVIHTLKGLGEITLRQQDSSYGIIHAQAGVTCAKFAKFAASNSLVGAEFFAGIPGTMGGALAMNAGAWGGETWNYVTELHMINRYGQVVTRTPQDFAVGYRTVVNHNEPAEYQIHPELQQEWFVAATFKFPVGDIVTAENKLRSLIQIRNEKQPIGSLSCGSVFRNPLPKYAAELIESSKLKGRRIGGAIVSTKHANFILNDNAATATDVEQLITLVKQQVYQDHQIHLHPEVKFLGIPFKE